MEKSTKKRVRNVVLGMTSVALVAGITASLTLAYLTNQTETIENIFTNSPEITAKLIEPAWDGDFDGDSSMDSQESSKVLNNGWTLGSIKALDYTVGDRILKNPQILNTSATTEYAAISVEYQVALTKADVDKITDGDTSGWTTISAEDFANIATFSHGAGNIPGINSDDWQKLSNVNAEDKKEYYVYGTNATGDATNSNLTSVDSKASTAALFDAVTVITPPAEPVDLSDGGKLMLSESYPLPRFRIVLKGAAIDTANEETKDDQKDSEGNALNGTQLLSKLLGNV